MLVSEQKFQVLKLLSFQLLILSTSLPTMVATAGFSELIRRGFPKEFEDKGHKC